jgi:hypothetical protein
MVSAQERWDRMSPADRDRHVAYYDRTARAAYDHCCSILIGCPHRSTAEANNATGVFLLWDDHHYVVTAQHVIDGFVKKVTDDPPAHFQINNLVLNPLNRIVFQDEENDLVVLALDPHELHNIGKTPYRPVGAWPPAPPGEGAFVQLAGFAKANRINGGRGTIENFSLHMNGYVMPTQRGNFFVRIERDGIPTENVGLAVSPGQSLGGMSGGPVMLFFQEPLPLIGVISEMSALMDAVLVGSLSHLRIPPRSSFSLP